MANNPFYPGYIPDPKSGSVQPLYPGYFPGQAKTRLPKPTNFLKPMEFNVDQIMEFIDGFDYGYGAGAPKWVYDRFYDDFKQQLKAQVKPAQVDAQDLDDFDPNTLPGAFGVGLNLNPVDWIKNPGKELKSTLNSWVKGVVNPTDIDTRYKAMLWNNLMGREPGDLIFPMENMTTEIFGSRLTMGEKIPFSLAPPTATSPTPNPLDIKHSKIRAEAPIYAKSGNKVRLDVDPDSGFVDANLYYTKYNPMTKLSESIVDFQNKMVSPPLRERAYDTMVLDALHAAAAVANQTEYNKRLADPTVAPAVRSDMIRAKQVFKQKLDLADNIQNLTVKFGDVQSELDKHYLRAGFGLSKPQMPKGGDAFDAVLAYESTLRETKAKIDQILSPKGLAKIDSQEAAKMAKFLAPLKAHLDDIENNATIKPVLETARLINQQREGIKGAVIGFNDIEKQFKKDQKLYHAAKAQYDSGLITKAAFDAQEAIFNTANATFTARKTAFDAGISSLRDRLSTYDSKEFLRAMSFTGKGSLAKAGWGGGDIFSKNYSSALARNILDTEVNGIPMRGGKAHLRDVMDLVDAKERYALRILTKECATEHAVAGIREFVNAAERGPAQLMEIYVWKRAMPFLKGYTPAAYTEKFMKKIHYLGLVIDDEKGFEKSIFYLGKPKAYDKTGGLIDPLKAPSKLFGNYFGIDATVVDGKYAGKFVKASNIFGGEHFKAINKLDGLVDPRVGNWKSATILELLREEKTVGGVKIKGAAEILMGGDPQEINKLLAELAKKNKTKRLKLVNVSEEDYYKFGEQLKYFREWWKKNKGNIETNFSAKEEGAFLATTIRALGKKNKNPDFRNIGIVKRYAGPVQKLYIGLNTIQTKILEKYVAKILAPYTYVRKMIAEAVGIMAQKVLAIIAGAASGGALAVVIEALGKVIQPIVRFVTEKVVDFVSGFVGNLLKGDFFGFFDTLEKNIMIVMKVMLIVVGIPLLILLFVSENFFGTVATTISPTDPTRGTGNISYFDGAPTGGPGTDVKNPISNPSTADPCFDFVSAGGTICNEDPSPTCYNLGTWPSNVLDLFNNKVIPTIKEHVGGYLNRLCGNPVTPITVYYSPDKPASNTWGHVFPGGKIIMTANNSWGEGVTTYVFTHETGHVYNIRVGLEEVPGIIRYGDARHNDGGSLPTYSGHCGDRETEVGEDFAETIGDFVQLNTYTCEDAITDWNTFWNTYPGHYEYVTKVLTRPYP